MGACGAGAPRGTTAVSTCGPIPRGLPRRARTRELGPSDYREKGGPSRLSRSRKRFPVPLESPARFARAAEWDFRRQLEAEAVVPLNGRARALLPVA